MIKIVKGFENEKRILLFLLEDIEKKREA